MIAEKRIKIDIDRNLDAMYINFLDASYNSHSDLSSEEISTAVYRVFDDNRPYITYRYVIMDMSFQDFKKLSQLLDIPILKEYI